MKPQLLAGRNWHKEPGAKEAAIEAIRKLAPKKLPESYFDLLRFSNGGEGPLPVQPLNFCLYSAEEVVEIETEGVHKPALPHKFVIGGNGGGEAIALDLRSEPSPVVAYDMNDMYSEESVVPLAASFEELLQMIGLEEG